MVAVAVAVVVLWHCGDGGAGGSDGDGGLNFLVDKEEEIKLKWFGFHGHYCTFVWIKGNSVLCFSLPSFIVHLMST